MSNSLLVVHLVVLHPAQGQPSLRGGVTRLYGVLSIESSAGIAKVSPLHIKKQQQVMVGTRLSWELRNYLTVYASCIREWSHQPYEIIVDWLV